MLSQLVNWDYVVEHAGDDRGGLPIGLLDTYTLVATEADDDDAGIDVHFYEGLWCVIVLPWAYDDTGDDETEPDPWSDAYRKDVDARVDCAQFYASFAEAATEIRDLGEAAGAAARLLPTLDRFSERPPSRHSTW